LRAQGARNGMQSVQDQAFAVFKTLLLRNAVDIGDAYQHHGR
jgi:hypothetical protein